MANHHLRNKALSLKAKGLLSLMLSLPEDWDYTTRGLSCICKDGVDSIRVGLQELEANGYLVRERHRNENGQYGAIEYTILEKPRQVAISPPVQEQTYIGKSNAGNSYAGFSYAGDSRTIKYRRIKYSKIKYG